MTVLCFPVIFSVGLWSLWARNGKELLREILVADNLPESRGSQPLIFLLASFAFCLLLSFNVNYFFNAGWNRAVGSWILRGEDGVSLAWAQSIFSGGVYGKNTFGIYGPMEIYPLVLFMKIFGKTIPVERFYKYFLDLVAYGIVLFFLFKTLRLKTTFLLFSLLSAFIFHNLFDPIQATYLRVVIGIFPLLLLYDYFGNAKRYELFLSGLVIGQSLLFFQEGGICALVAVIATLTLCRIPEHRWRLVTKEALLVVAGCLVSILPMLFYLYVKGALISSIEDMYLYTKVFMLGYGGLPFPAFREFIAMPFSADLLFYWPILFYAFAAIYLAVLLTLGNRDRDVMLKVSLLIFGMLVFRRALGRSNWEDVDKVLAPAVLLEFLLLDGAITTTVLNKRPLFLRMGSLVMSGVLIAATAIVFVVSPLKYHFASTWYDLAHFNDKFSIIPQGIEIPSLTRGGIFYERSTAASINRIYGFLKSNTKPGDYVYFFPNEAVYYFLFNRNNPTKFAISYNAATTGQRKELVQELEENKPEFVVYSLGTWRIDNITEDRQVPEVLRYIAGEYKPYSRLGNVMILKSLTR